MNYIPGSISRSAEEVCWENTWRLGHVLSVLDLVEVRPGFFNNKEEVVQS